MSYKTNNNNNNNNNKEAPLSLVQRRFFIINHVRFLQFKIQNSKFKI